MHTFRFKTVTRNMLIALAVSLVMILVAFVVVGKPKHAIAGVPFGGRSMGVYFCNCSWNFLITVSGPMGGEFMFQPGGSILYPYGQIYNPDVWLLGLAEGGSSCMEFAGKTCIPVGAGPVITMVGTSMD
jgi:hypothetical protein